MALVVAVWWLLGRQGTVSEDLAVALGPRAAEVREVDLHFLCDGSVARDVTLQFPAGAPAEAHHSIQLKAGHYEVGVRVVFRDGVEVHVGREYQTGQSEAIALDRLR